MNLTMTRCRPYGVALGGLLSASAMASTLFSSQETERIRQFWETPGRYQVALPNQWETRGIWQVRLTVEGSKWLHTVARNGSNKKPIPGQIAKPESPERVQWETWIRAKLAFDRGQAAEQAYQLNRAVQVNAKPPVAPPKAPEEPPETLVQLAGLPPKLADAVVPVRHTVQWDEKTTVDFHDHTEVSERYPFYRFDEGVMLAGKALRKYPEGDLKALYAEAGISPFERKVMEAVSGLEGGFEAVNTYDTGYVSVGFIQFASLSQGGGSLGKLLWNYKLGQPKFFESDFRRFGVDVTLDAKLAALDLDLYVPRIGPDANLAIIQDKRLIAVFHRAGLLSQPFRVAQLRTAKAEYYPGERPVELSINGVQLSFKVGDIISSEAGMATLMDRLVNTGTLDPLPMVLITQAASFNLKTVADFAQYELQIVTAMKYRKDYLKDMALTQPKPIPQSKP